MNDSHGLKFTESGQLVVSKALVSTSDIHNNGLRFRSDGALLITTESSATTYHSTNPSFEQSGGTVVVRRNYIKNPSFESNTSGWSSANGSLTRYIDSTAPYGRCLALLLPFGTNMAQIVQTLSASERPMKGNFSFGAGLSSRSTVDSASLTVLLEKTNSPWTNYLDGAKTVTVTKNWQRFNFNYTVPEKDASASMNVIFRIDNGTNNAPNGVRIDGIKIEDTLADLLYFDGSMNDGFDTASLRTVWTGAPNNSPSFLEGDSPVGIFSPSSPIWQSVDNPKSGSKIARALIKQPATDFRVIDTRTVAAGSTVTATMNIRSADSPTIQPQWNSSVGLWLAQAGQSITLSPGWNTITRERVTTTPNEGLGFNINASVGSVVDVDDHMITKQGAGGVLYSSAGRMVDSGGRLYVSLDPAGSDNISSHGLKFRSDGALRITTNAVQANDEFSNGLRFASDGAVRVIIK